METTLLSLAKSVMSGVAGQAKSVIKEEVALQLGVHRDLAFINDEFEMMQNFLMAADEEGGEKKVVRAWVRQVRDLGYDVEDSLLDYALHLDKSSWWRFLCTLRRRRAIAKEIKDLKARVDDVSHRNLRYRLIEDPSSKPATAADRYLSSTASAFGIDGARRAAREDKNKKVDLAELITKGSQELMVITVWGTSNDVGKMSTIRKAYDDARVTRKFRCRAWVKLSHPFNPAEFLQSIVRQFYGNSDGLTPQQGRTMGVHISRSMSSKQAKLEDEYDRHVSNNQYMIVIEDLSTVTEWDWLKLYLPDKNNGSRIVVSTQQIELASLCVGEPNQVSELKQFSSDQTLYIFHQKEDTADLAERNEANGARTEAREKVIKLISQDSKQREIISVWGTDGPQKTALLRSIYDGKDLDGNKFQKRAWITVSHPPIADQVTSLVLELKARFPVKQENPADAIETAELMQVLGRLMGGHECLIVLDGVSTGEEWDSLANYLPRDEGCSSRIVLTTTERIVAEHCSVKGQNTFKIEVLEDDAAINNIDANRNKDSELAQRAWTEAREKVIKLISQDSMQREIISVWGTDGSQNTSLARSIYDGKELDSNKFQKRAWITLSHPISDQVNLVLELKASSLVSEHNSEAREAVELIQELAKLLQKQKYLIGLDGISGKEEWNLLVNHLPAEENGSRIVVSTTEQSVAEHCSGSGKSQNTYKLNVQKVDDDNKNKEKQPAVLSGNMPESKTSSTQKGTAHEEPQLIGRETEISRITDMLVGDMACQVILVSGMGGVGKSSLVESIYHSPDIKERFPRRAWANVSQPFDPEEFMRSLAPQLKKLPSDNSSLLDNMLSRRQSSSTETSAESVESSLKTAKHLIVVDGLSSVTEWDKGVECLLRAAANGSWIIVTTGDAGVGEHYCVPKENNIVVECLEYADAFELFRTKVSEIAENFESDPEMMEQAKHIVRKCGGLPLAIVTIGGFLSSRPATTMEWRKLNDHIGVELEVNSSLKSINKMVISSYKGLPHHLKSCFLYLSIFPEGHNVRRRRLVRRWIAEAYSSEMLTKSAEEFGEQYFTELISRSMIQPSKTRAANCGRVSLCRVNNLMHAISISKSKEENLVSVLDDSGFSLSSRDKVRHLVVSRTWSRDKKNALEKIMDVSRLRSLTVFGEWQRFLVSSKMRLLRVLDLEDATGLRDSDLVTVGKLRHLKYLSLRGSKGIINLPKSFGKLLNLETLDIRGTLVTTLPAGMVNLPKLSYLRAGYIPDDEDDSSIDLMEAIVATVILSLQVCKSCISMGSADEQQREAVKNFGPLFCFFMSVLLKRVDPHGVKLPRRIGKLKNLHTLGVVNVARGKSGIKELKNLTKLRKLGVTGINKGNSKDLCSAISDMTLLESLSLRSEGKNGLKDCLTDISPVPTNLQTLKIYGNLAELPGWMNYPKLRNNLVKLTLRSTLLVYKDAVEVLEQLKKLVILCLWKDAFQEGELHINFGADTFPTLKRLEIAHLMGLKQVSFEKNAMAGLEIMLVEGCMEFCQGGFQGVPHLKKLKEVWVKGNYPVEFKDKLRCHVGSTLIMVD